VTYLEFIWTDENIEHIAEFLIGVRSLDSSTIDKIAALLKQELRPIG